MGSTFYPALGLAALLFTIATAIAFRFDRPERGSRGVPMYSAALLSIAWASITRAMLVPAMFSLKAANNLAELRQILATYTRWSGVNDVLHVLTFSLSLWALADVMSSPKAVQASEETLSRK